MIRLSTIAELRSWTAAARRAEQRIALVPTMGALHAGHLALVAEARRRAPLVVMSLFVNPLQFGPSEDFARYPRPLERDAGLASASGVDALYTPTVEMMYPPGSETRVVPGRSAERWEGEIRPGHFTGVLTVVAKFFNQVQPDVAIFGQKDVQQLTLIRRMVADLDWPIEIVMVPTVRESDGLALSSRNAYLESGARVRATAISRALLAASEAWGRGEQNPERLRQLVLDGLSGAEGLETQYLAILDPETLQPVEIARVGTIIALAVRSGTTRLLDNVILGSTSE
ncbi:MAG: pantoate--beta-alanine ligase [Gemmatimonadota bacterium]